VGGRDIRASKRTQAGHNLRYLFGESLLNLALVLVRNISGQFLPTALLDLCSQCFDNSLASSWEYRRSHKSLPRRNGRNRHSR
jgi:hypothetical protein